MPYHPHGADQPWTLRDQCRPGRGARLGHGKGAPIPAEPEPGIWKPERPDNCQAPSDFKWPAAERIPVSHDQRLSGAENDKERAGTAGVLGAAGEQGGKSGRMDKPGKLRLGWQSDGSGFPDHLKASERTGTDSVQGAGKEEKSGCRRQISGPVRTASKISLRACPERTRTSVYYFLG